MNDRLAALKVFVRVAHVRSFSRAAKELGLSQPTVHHHLSQLRAAGLVRVHFFVASPSRYSLRPRALEQLSEQLGMFLTSTTTPAQESPAR